MSTRIQELTDIGAGPHHREGKSTLYGSSPFLLTENDLEEMNDESFQEWKALVTNHIRRAGDDMDILLKQVDEAIGELSANLDVIRKKPYCRPIVAHGVKRIIGHLEEAHARLEDARANVIGILTKDQ
jgi:hypothetical protein